MFKKIIQGIFNYGIGKFIPKAINFLLIPVYAHYLTPSDFGVFELGNSINAFLVPLMLLGVSGAIPRFYLDEDNDSYVKDLIKTILKILVYSTLTISLVAYLIGLFFGEFLFGDLPLFPFYCFVLIGSVLNVFSEVQNRTIIARQDSKYSAKLNIFTSVVSITFGLCFIVVFRQGVMGMFVSQLLTSFVVFIVAIFYLKDNLTGTYQRNLAKKVLNYGYGLLPHHIFATLAPLISRSILAGVVSSIALGIYSISVRLLLPLTLLYSSFNLIFEPIYYQLRLKNDEQGRVKLINSVILIALLVYIVFNFLIIKVFSTFLPETYQVSIQIMPLVSLGFIAQVYYVIFVIELFFLKTTKYISLITLSGLIVNLVASIVLISRFGIYGIALAQVLEYITWAIASHILFRKLSNVKLDLITYFLGQLIVLFSFIAFFYIENGPLFYITLVGCLSFIVLSLIRQSNGRLF